MIKEFYDKHNFPGHYTSDDVSLYLGQNKFIQQMDKYIPTSRRVLDAGCGTGFISNYFAFKYPQSHFYGVDFSNAIEHARHISSELSLSNIVHFKGDICEFGLQDSFDTIICQGVLHHIPNYLKAVKNLKNLLSLNGHLLVGVYHPFSKKAQKLLPLKYESDILKTDQLKNPFELSFTKSQVCELFHEFTLIEYDPFSLFNFKNGGLTIYVFRKENSCV